LRAQGQPTERFAAGEPAVPWLQKPHFEQSQVPSTKKAWGTGQKVALGAACLAAGAGLAVGIMNVQGPPPVRVELSQRQSQKAGEQFSYLEQVGGTLRSEPGNLVEKLFNHQPEVDAQGAVQTLTRGQTVFWYSSEDGPPIEIHNTEGLRELTSRVRTEMVKQQLQRGVEEVAEGLKSLGQEIGDIFR
jgi:hypothetical protein